jgi:hypothetical protein
MMTLLLCKKKSAKLRPKQCLVLPRILAAVEVLVVVSHSLSSAMVCVWLWHVASLLCGVPYGAIVVDSSDLFMFSNLISKTALPRHQM